MENVDLKILVRERYEEIAKMSHGQPTKSCCVGGVQCSEIPGLVELKEEYSRLCGYYPQADLKLGCGIPTEAAKIKAGQTVLDLGSGAGNDVFIARALVGETGRVIGLDMTEAMIVKARKNAAALGYTNVEFKLGDIENMPVDSETVDVIISNCVLNLVPDKLRAFKEMFRTLKRGGHFVVSDIVLTRELPLSLKGAAEMYVGCISGASLKEDYLSIISAAGFKNIQVKAEKAVNLPLDLVHRHLSPAERRQFNGAGAAFLSITVYGEKHY